KRKFRIVADDQVQKSIAIVVEPCCACGPLSSILQSRVCCDIGERAVSVVVKERAVRKSSDENVLVPIVVEVRNRYAHAVMLDLTHTRSLGDIYEFPITQVSIESISHRLFTFAARCLTAIHEENVLPAVVIKINETNATAHG